MIGAAASSEAVSHTCLCELKRSKCQQLATGSGKRKPATVHCKDTGHMNSRMAASSSRVMLGPLVAAIDQGTSSTRFLVSYNPRSRIEWFFSPNGECPLNNLVRHPVDSVITLRSPFLM